MRHALQRNIDKDIKYLFSEPFVQRCSVKKGALRDFARFTCQSLFFNKFTGLRPGILSKKRLWHKYFFPVDFAKFLRTHFFHRKPLVAAFVL